MSDKQLELDERELTDDEIKYLAAFLKSTVDTLAKLEDVEDVSDAYTVIVDQFKDKQRIYNQNVDKLLAALEKVK